MNAPSEDPAPLVVASGSTALYASAESVVIDSDLDGDLLLVGPVRGDVTLVANVSGAVLVTGRIEGTLRVRSRHIGSLAISGTAGSVTVSGATSVENDVLVLRGGTVSGSFLLGGSIGGSCVLEPTSVVDGDIELKAALNGSFVADGAIHGSLVLSSECQGQFLLSSDSDVSGNVSLAKSCSVGGSASLLGRVSGRLVLAGALEKDLVLRPSSPLLVWSMRGMSLSGDGVVGDLVRLDQCDFRDAVGLGRLQLIGSSPFPSATVLGRAVEQVGLRRPKGATHREMAAVYRRLRTALEGQGNRPGASAFYRGEMRSRLAETIDARDGVGLIVVGGYGLLSGFGTRPARALFWFIIVGVLGALGFGHGGFGADAASVAFAERFQFAVQSMVSFFRPPEASLTYWEVWIQIFLRFVGPILLAQFAIALRDRVVR